jgi:3-oxoacyl-[acyl-carrier-protein] synthase III
MFVAAIQHEVPGVRLDNEGTLALLAAEAKQSGEPLRDDALAYVRSFLAACGSEYRHVRGPGETALTLIKAAAQRALRSSALDPARVDLVIYCGVSRGWVEPAIANRLIAELGLSQATGFDVLDACAGWLRALQLADALLASGQYGNALVLSGEFNRDLGRPVVIPPVHVPSLAVAATIGEAATAAVLLPSPQTDSAFRFANFGEYFDLCNIPLEAPHLASWDETAAARMPRFFAEPDRLVPVTVRRLISLYRSDARFQADRHDLVVGHAASEAAVDLVCRRLSIAPERCLRSHAKFGNTVTSSIPLAMSIALQEGRVAPGTRCLFLVGSAGVSIGLASILVGKDVACSETASLPRSHAQPGRSARRVSL